MNTPVPEWTKQILASAGKAEAGETVSVPEPAETDVPEDVQAEVRALAAAEASLALEAPPAELPEESSEEESPPEDLKAEEEALEAEAEAEAPAEPPEPERPPRPPRRFEFLFRAGPLKAFLAQAENLVDEAKVTADREGWRVLAVDPAHVAMIDLRLAGIEGLERRDGKLYAIDEEVSFGVDVAKLLHLVKKAKKDDTIRLTADLPNGLDKDELTLEIGAMRRTMAAIDTEGMADPKVPALNLQATVEVSAAALLEAAKAAEDVTDHVRLTATREGLNVFGEGDVDKSSVDLAHNDAACVERIGPEGKYTSLFPLDYFMAFLKTVKHEEKLVLQLGTDYPVRVDWDGVTKGTWLLAPRIESPGY